MTTTSDFRMSGTVVPNISKGMLILSMFCIIRHSKLCIVMDFCAPKELKHDTMIT